MAEQGLEPLIREFVGALASGDVEKAVSCFADDGAWEAPHGSFRGKEELRRYISWMAESNTDVTIADAGIGIAVLGDGDSAVFEHVIGGTFQGQRWETLAMCVYEFVDGKIRTVRAVFDRLAVAQQAAPGWLARRLVGMVVNSTQKGLG